jgi:hypothetical protein
VAAGALFAAVTALDGSGAPALDLERRFTCRSAGEVEIGAGRDE